MRGLPIYQTPNEVPLKSGSPVVAHFGGINLYGATEKGLSGGIAKISESITKIGEKSAGLNISLYNYLVEQDLKQKVPKRIFSALVGRQLRDGNLDAVICEGPKGTAFRVLLTQKRLIEFHERVDQVLAMLVRDQTLGISSIRDMFFKQKQKGAWTQAMYIAARLVRLGLAVFDEPYAISMPSMIRNALLSADR